MTTGPIDRQRAFSGTKDVAPPLRIDGDRLADYLAAHIDGLQGPLKISQFRGGQSNPTYLVEARGGRYVLRRKPPGALLPSAHAVDREFRVISALGKAGFPVPKAHVLCTDDGVIGTMFYVMDFVTGRVIWEPHMPASTPDERAAVYDNLNETIARLHSFDPQALGLGDFGKPANYVARQVARWSKQYVASRTEEVPDMVRLMQWLPENVPPEGPARLVHGDFRLDNTILHAQEPRIVAVLDWELSTLGDPLADFTYHLMQWVMPRSQTGGGVGSLSGLDLAALGIPALEAYVERYARLTGRDGIHNLDFYFAYNFFRLAAIFQGIVGRVRDGTATNENAPMIASQVRPLAATAWDYARRAGARKPLASW